MCVLSVSASAERLTINTHYRSCSALRGATFFFFKVLIIITGFNVRVSLLGQTTRSEFYLQLLIYKLFSFYYRYHIFI